MGVGTEAKGCVLCTVGAVVQYGCTMALGSLLPRYSPNRLKPKGMGAILSQFNKEGFV